MPRLLYVSQKSFYPEASGGAQLSTLEILNRLMERGWEVEVLAGLFVPWSRFYFRGITRSLRVGKVPGLAVCDQTLGFACWRRIKAQRIPLLSTIDRWLTAKFLKKRLAAFKPDVVLGDTGVNCPLLRGALASGCRCVYLARNMPVLGTPSILPQNLHLLGNSQYTAGILEAISMTSVDVVHPMVTHAKYRCKQRDPEFVTFVNPIPHKGLDVAIKIARKMPETRFLFVKGRWAVMSPRKVEAFIKSARMLENVEIWDYREDMREVYAVTKTLLMPSQFIEAFGRVIVEAQINGIPVVAARSGGIPKTVGLGGIIIDPKDDVDAYVAALRDLEKTPSLHQELSAHAIANIQGPDFDPDVQFEILLNFLENRVLAAAP